MTSGPAEARVLVLRAKDEAEPHAPPPPTNRRYRHPQISLERRELGPVPAGHVRVEMIYAGICGTDLHLLQSDPETGFVRTSAAASIPAEGRVIGHEGVGRILAVGHGVDALRPATIAAFSSILACLRCNACGSGAPNQCRTAQLLGMQIDGLFGTVVDVPAQLAQDITGLIRDDDDLRAASCLEPAGVALLACEKLRIAPGESVAVFGAGPIGLYCAMASKRVFGAARVFIIEPLPFRRRLAELWCDAVFETSDDLEHAVRELDIVIEASGHVGNIDRIFRRIGPGGRVMLLGRSGNPLAIDGVDHMITQSISIMGSRGHLGMPFRKILSLHQEGRLKLDRIITTELASLEDLCAALGDVDHFAETQCKTIARLDGAGMDAAHAETASAFT